MSFDPVATVLADASLREQLIRRRLSPAFDDEAAENTAHLSGGEADELAADMAESVVSAALGARSDLDAFLAYRAAGWHAGSGALAAFEEVFGHLERDLASVVASQSHAADYEGPLTGPAVVEVSDGRDRRRAALAVPHPALTREGRAALVHLVDGAVAREQDGSLDWTTAPWHRIVRVHARRPVPAFDPAEVARLVEADRSVPEEGDDPLLAALRDLLGPGPGDLEDAIHVLPTGPGREVARQASLVEDALAQGDRDAALAGLAAAREALEALARSVGSMA